MVETHIHHTLALIHCSKQTVQWCTVKHATKEGPLYYSQSLFYFVPQESHRQAGSSRGTQELNYQESKIEVVLCVSHAIGLEICSELAKAVYSEQEEWCSGSRFFWCLTEPAIKPALICTRILKQTSAVLWYRDGCTDIQQCDEACSFKLDPKESQQYGVSVKRQCSHCLEDSGCNSFMLGLGIN